jgi:hypothetical protein
MRNKNPQTLKEKLGMRNTMKLNERRRREEDHKCVVTKALKRVDLPTLGRPTMPLRKLMHVTLVVLKVLDCKPHPPPPPPPPLPIPPTSTLKLAATPGFAKEVGMKVEENSLSFCCVTAAMGAILDGNSACKCKAVAIIILPLLLRRQQALLVGFCV